MTTRLGLWLAAGAAVLVASAAASAAPPNYRNPIVSRELAYQIPNMQRARVRRGLVYTRAGGSALRMDVYRPRRARTGVALPAVLLGGPPAFRAGRTSGQKVGWAQLVAASGLAAVAFDIRSDGFMATPEAPSADVATAISPWHLWAALHEPAPFIRCNAFHYGPFDLETVSLPIEPSRVAEYSAITYLRRRSGDIPPMLVAKAGREANAGINDSIDRFAAAARQLSAPLEVLVHARGSHGFDTNRHDERSRAIIRRTLSFFRERLR